jgi:hypothetical protein
MAMSCKKNKNAFHKQKNTVFNKGEKYNNWDIKQNSVGARTTPVGKRGNKAVGKRGA